jgi:hypothetical protein
MAVSASHGATGALVVVLRRLALVVVVAVAVAVAGVAAIGFVVEGIQPPLERSDAIIVISGDENLARHREGIRLWRDEWAPILIFSGAAREGPISNAADMRRRALAEGVPQSSILLDEQGADTYGNALQTRRLMEAHGLRARSSSRPRTICSGPSRPSRESIAAPASESVAARHRTATGGSDPGGCGTTCVGSP